MTLISPYVGQLIRSGRTMQLFTLVLMTILVYLSYELTKRGSTWKIRPLEALQATYEGIGRAAEMNKPIMMLPGLGNLGNPQTIAGLTMLGELTQKAADIGVDIITVATNTTTVAASEAVVRSAYGLAGKEELYSPGKQVNWFGSAQFAYAIGVSGAIMTEKPAMVVFLGYFMWDIIITAETGARVGALQIGGTVGADLPMIAMFCDHILIGEEMYAVSASITGDKFEIATLASQDWIKTVLLVISLIGGLLMMAGSSVIVDLLRT